VIHIVQADSENIYRVGIQQKFALEDDTQVIAQADTLAGLHGTIQDFPIDAILLVEGKLIASTVDSIPDLVRRAPKLKIIVNAPQNDETDTVELYLQGVQGIIPRCISPDLLVKCVRRIAAGETWIDNQSINWVIEAYRSQATALTSPRTQPRLSPKELAIVTCITQGKRNKEIAYQLGTTEQVIKNYLRKVYNKLGVSDRLGLAPRDWGGGGFRILPDFSFSTSTLLRLRQDAQEPDQLEGVRPAASAGGNLSGCGRTLIFHTL
jgi:two-component system, NarL family, nitrate/nitrite response regulator NarL